MSFKSALQVLMPSSDLACQPAVAHHQRSFCRRQRATPGRSTTHHFRQRPAVHGQGLQGIHPHRRYDARPHVAVLSAIKRENRTLAQIPQTRVHSARNAGCLPTMPGACSKSMWITTIQCAPQRDRIRDSAGHAGWPTSRDPYRPRSQTRGGAPATSTPPTGSMKPKAIMTVSDETEAG